MAARFIGWAVDRHQRDALLQHFRPAYDRVVADHVTLKYDGDRPPAPPTETEGEIVGFVDDGEGVQAAVVRIGGSTHRPDGGTYHITWSLGDGREAKESNEAIARCGWKELAAPVKVHLQPQAYPP